MNRPGISEKRRYIETPSFYKMEWFMQSSPSAFIDAPASLNEGLSVVLPGSRLRALVRSRICRSRGAHGSFCRQPPLFRHRPLRCAVTVIPVLHGVGMFPLSEPFLKTRRVSEGGRLTTRQGRRRSALLHGNQRLRDSGWPPLLSSVGLRKGGSHRIRKDRRIT